MKHILTILTIMTTLVTNAQDGKASTTKKTFSRQTRVSINIQADPTIVWALLTNGSDFTRWNSTVTMLEGEIEVGEKIRLKSVLDDKRIFKIKVKEMISLQSMTWGDGSGTRVFTLESIENGVKFTMDEKMGGLMFPMYAKMIPPFDENFEQFASDLKQEAELIQNEK